MEDLDLSKYKLAYFNGDSMDSEMCLDDAMKLADAGETELELNIALIPKDKRLQDCGGDDWNDTPASCNASGFYHYPEGTIFLKGKLGGELKLSDGKF